MPQITKDKSISVYKDYFTVPAAIEQFQKLKNSFPQLPPGFYDVLLDRIKEHGFTNERLKDAINHLIDNFNYPVPTIANIISFDKKVKLYTYDDILALVDKYGESVWENYKLIDIGTKKMFFASVADIEIYNLKLYEK